MSVVRKTYRCDWPNCDGEITADERRYSLHDFGWEGRGLDGRGEFRWHACPEHRFRTTADFEAAIDAEREKEA